MPNKLAVEIREAEIDLYILEAYKGRLVNDGLYLARIYPDAVRAYDKP